MLMGRVSVSGGIPPVGSGESIDRRRGPGGPGSGTMYTDSQQLFLGNLPHHATEDDLKVGGRSVLFT